MIERNATSPKSNTRSMRNGIRYRLYLLRLELEGRLLLTDPYCVVCATVGAAAAGIGA